MAAREWDATTYDRIADPMARWGAAVLDRLPLAGDETVLDAGCGTGRVTELLLERLPAGRVVALDGSSAMLDGARERLARFADHVDYVHADLLQPLPIGRVDAILSTATFHWVLDHERLFANLAAVLRPGGRLAAQCGGRGNIAHLEAVLRDRGETLDAHLFAGPEETAARLAAAGFTEIRTWLHEEPTPIQPGEPWETFLRTVCLGPYLARLPQDRWTEYVHDVAQRMGEPVLDYVRLNIDATRAA